MQVRQALAEKVSKERVGTELKSMMQGMYECNHAGLVLMQLGPAYETFPAHMEHSNNSCDGTASATESGKHYDASSYCSADMPSEADNLSQGPRCNSSDSM